MTPPPDPPPTVATMRTIGWVWVVVGALALLGGLVATVFVIVLFGILAILLGAGLIAIQHVRAESAIRASRTLTNAPAPPAGPPPSTPAPPPPGPGEEPEGEAAVGPPDDAGSGGHSGGEAEQDSEGDSGGDSGADPGAGSRQDVGAEAGHHTRDGGVDGDDGVVVDESETSISEEDDGTGSPVDGDDTRGTRHDLS